VRDPCNALPFAAAPPDAINNSPLVNQREHLDAAARRLHRLV
jgi:hypothetical protein